MPKQNIINTNFTSGEVSPLVRGRVDAQKYGNGLETCENFIVRPQGPIWRRSGTEYLGQTKLLTEKSILVPFEYSDTKGYVVEIGLGYIHFWDASGKLPESTKFGIQSHYAAENSGLLQIQVSGLYTNIQTSASTSKLATPTLSDNGSGILRVTTDKPHTLRTGVVLSVVTFTIGGSPTTLYNKPVTRINNYTFDIDGLTASTYLSATAVVIGVPNVLPGDRIRIIKSKQSNIVGKNVIVHSLQNETGPSDWYKFTTNLPFTASSPPTYSTNSEGKIGATPIEIHTDYGFLPSKKIAAITASTTKINIQIDNHGYSSGDTVEIYLSNNAAEGTWVITRVDANNFTLDGSTWIANTTSGYARKYVGTTQLDELRFVQSADVLYIMHPDHPVYKLTRLSDDGDRDDWLFAQVDFKDGPYLPLNSLAPTWDETTPANGSRFADVYFELSSYSHTATVTSAVGWDDTDVTASPAGDENGYIEYREGDQWRLAKLPGTLTAGAKTATVEIIDNVLLHLDESIKYKLATKSKVPLLGNVSVVSNAGSPNMTPSLPGAGVRKRVDPNNYLYGKSSTSPTTLHSNFSNTFGTADVGKFVRYFHGATPAPFWSKITKVAEEKPGNQCSIDAAVKMAKSNSTGNFEITNHSRTATLKAYKNGATFAAFKTTDINRLFRIGWAGRWTWGKITAFTSTSQVSVSLYEDVPRDPHNAANLAGATNGALTASDTTGRSYDWRMGSWSETTGYPSCGVFHEQRLWFGRTDTEPQTIWGSVSGDFENFSPTELDSAVLEDNAIGFTIASTKANPIKWMVSGPAITVGTTGGEWQVKSSSVSSEPITPLNIVVVPHTSHGSHNKVQPIRLGNSILFADRPGNRVRELIYDFSVDALISRDLTYLSEHMLRENSGAIYSAYQQEPNNICWYVLGDGTLAAVTINKDQEVVAWHHHTIADATVESVAVVPSTDSSKDNVYMVVKRGSNRYVELLQDDFYPNGSNRKGMRYLDGAIVFSGTDFSGTKVAGLHHLEGKTVTVSIDGTLLGTYTVTSGIATIASQSGKELVVGLAYTSTAKSLPPEGGSAFGVSQGKIKKLAKYNVRLLNSLALDYGFNANSQTLNSLTNLHENGTSTDFYTGTKELIPNNPYDAESQWTLSTSKPYPLNILSVTLTVETGE